MFKKLRLSHKLVLLFMLMALIVALTGVFGLWSLGKTSDLLEMHKRSSAQEKMAVLMKVTLQGGRVNLLEAALTQDDPDEFEICKIDYELKRDTFLGYCDILGKGNPKLNIPAAEPGSLLESRVLKVRDSIKGLDLVAGRLLSHKEELITLGKKDDAALHQIATADLMRAVDAASVAVDDLLVEVGRQAIAGDDYATVMERRSSIAFTTVIFAGIFLAVLLGVLATRNIVLRLNILAASLLRGAEGDLTAVTAVSSDDELGQLGNCFNQMLERLSLMMGEVKRTALELGEVASAITGVSREVIRAAEVQQNGLDETSAAILKISGSQHGISKAVDTLSLSSGEASLAILKMADSIEEVAGLSDYLATSVGQVTSAISETAATIRQIESNVNTVMYASTTTASSVAEFDVSVQEIEQSAQQAAHISAAVHKDAETGKEAVDATIRGIQEIRTSSQTTSDAIAALSGSVKDIGMILSVIHDVTEETRLLSFNAAIIAAQAGEHGRGFAVVSDEIKKLAEKTSESTREIGNLVNRIQEETERAVTSIQHAGKSIAEGEALSQKSGEALNKIVRGVDQTTTEIAGIARATREQAKGSQVIRAAMEKVSDMIDQIGTGTHQQSKASEHIMSEVRKMSDLTTRVRNFTREQSQEGRVISRLTEDVNAMIRQIKKDCQEQSHGSERIEEAVMRIQGSTRKNLASATIMGENVDRLSRQVVSLDVEVGNFRVIEEAEPPRRVGS